eukprot:CAMPEP_0116130910 /NCGR_PEP_ID=MMETSP0329-20121206/8724_1 /TAXON_ID=697910 /ORGANISM="Pseudo-nitzschia arenysensis, Strain B593" /LENGTH=556 /DNA_ID=CAMNT_0003625305 /DNA_START=53 /DNA_END=1721 /DNA_ORIENTATION=-
MDRLKNARYHRRNSDRNVLSKVLPKKSALVRYFILLSTAGIVVTVYRSIAFGVALDGPSPFNEALSTFAPPRDNLEMMQEKKKQDNPNTPKEEKKPRITQSAYRHQKGFTAEDYRTITFNLTHFFSHIPKTGAEYAAQELGSGGNDTVPGDKSILSIREAQVRYSNKLKSHPDYDETDPHWLFFDKNARNHDHANPSSDAYSPPMVCNNGKVPFLMMSPFHLAANKKLKYRCNLVMSEQPWTRDAENVYTIIRDPVSHVVSQYHHCADSNHHKNGHLMPTFNEWLDDYIKLADTLPLEKRPPYVVDRKKMDKKQRSMRKKYDCYDPIDSESTFVKFPVQVKDDRGKPLVLPKDYNYPYPPEKSALRDEETQKIDQLLFDDLKNRFRVHFPNDQDYLFFFIDMTDGKHIPTPCDCTHWDETSKQQHSSTPIFYVPSLYNKAFNKRRKSTIWIYRPFLEHGYHPEKHAHGVKTRGADFVKQNLTDYQSIKITHHLRTLDSVLYNISRAVFDEQTAELENRHGIKICDDSFNREGELDLEKLENPMESSKNKKVKTIFS